MPGLVGRTRAIVATGQVANAVHYGGIIQGKAGFDKETVSNRIGGIEGCELTNMGGLGTIWRYIREPSLAVLPSFPVSNN